MPSSRTPGLPTSVANPELQVLTKLVEKLALNVDDQARALAEALGRRGQPPSAQTASKTPRLAAATAAFVAAAGAGVLVLANLFKVRTLEKKEAQLSGA